MLTFVQVLKALQPVMDDNCSEALARLLDYITVLVDSSTDRVKPIATFIPKEVQITLIESLKELDTEKTELFSKVIKSGLQIMQEESTDLGELGEAWVNLGLLSMEMLAPQGPVDPVEKNMIKLKITEQDVSIRNR